MQTTTTSLFHALVEAIQVAVTAKSFYTVCDRATALGLLEEKVDLKCSIRYHFQHIDAFGAQVRLCAYAYDPSGPTQRRAPLTRFSLTLIEGDRVGMEYEAGYEGLVEARYADADRSAAYFRFMTSASAMVNTKWDMNPPMMTLGSK